MCRRLSGNIEFLVEPKAKDLGNFEVRRVLPAEERQRVGPFIFFDHMGPAVFAAGTGVSVRPHPHIGLATVTFLFDGEIMHRDSLGYVQAIRPGAVNWMTAGRGIVHSERTPEGLIASGSRLHGIQTWLALPIEAEETDPDFTHYPAELIPHIEQEGVSIQLISGMAYGQKSPVKTTSETFYAAVDLSREASIDIPFDIEERAVYVVQGEVIIDETVIPTGTMAILVPGAEISVRARDAARLMLLGGASLTGDRHLYWNFVGSRPERIERAKDDWRNDRFDKVPGETDLIPLPE